MINTKRHSVIYAFPTSHRFRVPFHDLLRKRLAAENVDYSYIYSKDDNDNLGKRDTKDIPWATSVPLTNIKGRLVYQHAYKQCRDADLVILQQQNSLLLNYPVLLKRRLSLQRVALIGHGRNLQSANPNGLSERFKKMWSVQADWWFAYTEHCAKTVKDLGFPRQRITVFNNAIDTNSLQAERASITDTEITELRDRLFGGSRNIGLFVGGLYPEKRLRFLIDAARWVRVLIPDFHLVMIGGGPEAEEMKAYQARWPGLIHYVGPKFGREKALYAAASRVFLMPGLVGLGVLDSFGYRLPMITTDYPFHSPEIDYLKPGYNGMMVRPYNDVRAYGDAVIRLMQDEFMCQRLVLGAQATSRDFTIEVMVDRFATGVMSALAAPVYKQKQISGTIQPEFKT